MSQGAPLPPADDRALWKSTAGSDLGPLLAGKEANEVALPRSSPPAESDENSANEGLSESGELRSFDDAAWAAATAGLRGGRQDDDGKRNRWRGAEHFASSEEGRAPPPVERRDAKEGTPAIGSPTLKPSTDSEVSSSSTRALLAIALAAVAVVIAVAGWWVATPSTANTPASRSIAPAVAQTAPTPPVSPLPAEAPPQEPPADPPAEQPGPAFEQGLGDLPLGQAIVAGAQQELGRSAPPSEPHPSPAPAPDVPASEGPAAVEVRSAPPAEQLRPFSSPRAETLLSMARQLEASGRLEPALRRYRELIEKHPGTAVAREAQQRLMALEQAGETPTP